MNTKTLLFLFCLITNSLALSPEGNEVYEELVEQLKAEIALLNADPVGNQNEIMFAKQYLRQIENAVPRQNNRNVLQILENFGNFDPSENVQNSIGKFRKALEKDSAAKTRAYIAGLEGTLKRAGDVVLTAEKPEDLDKTLESLNRNRFQNNGDEDFDVNDPTVRRLVNEMSGARQFVATWQDYIQSSNAGNIQQSVQSLRNLAQQHTDLIPRSHILARIAFEQGSDEKIDKIIGEIRTLDDMRDGIVKMSKEAGGIRGFEYGTTRQEIFSSLKRLDVIYRDFLAGLPVRSDVYQSTNDPSEATGHPVLVKLRADLLRLALPRMLDLPEDALPKVDESTESFLNRATREAVGREDFPAVLRIRKLQGYLAGASIHGDTDSISLRAYAAARLQIEAKQWMLAVISLQESLKSGCEFIPAAKVGESLEAIRREHPEEYKQGMDAFLKSKGN